MNSNENLYNRKNIENELDYEKWVKLMKKFLDKNYLELFYENDDLRQENFYQCLFYLLDSDEDLKEIINSSNDELFENPFNKFYGLSDVKPSKIKMPNPSVFHLNYTNINAIFSFLVTSLYDLHNEFNGKIERRKLKKLFSTNFNFFILKEISFLYNMDDNNPTEKPMNLYLLMITLEILFDLFGDQLTHVSIGITDYFMDYFRTDANIVNKSCNMENRIFYSDLYFAYISVFLFYNKIKYKSFNPVLNSVGLSLTIFEHLPDLLENYTFNAYLFEKFCKKGEIEIQNLEEYDLTKLIKTVSATSNIKDVKQRNKTAFSRLELSILSEHVSSKNVLNDLINFNSPSVFYKFLKLTILESIYAGEQNNFIEILINKIKTGVRNFSLIVIPLGGENKNIDPNITTVVELKRNIEIDLSDIINNKSTIRSISLQGNNFKIKSQKQISQIQEFHLYPNDFSNYSINFVYQFTHLSYLTLKNLSLENFEDFTSNWKSFRSLKSVDLSVCNHLSDLNINDKMISVLCKLLKNIYDLDLNNLSKIENTKIYIQNKIFYLEDELCRAFLYLMQKVSTLIYFSLIYKCDFEKELKSKYAKTATKSFFQEIKDKFPNYREESNRLNQNVFKSDDQMSYLLVSDSEMEHEGEKNQKLKNELISVKRWKIDNFISLFLLIHGTCQYKRLRRPPILVKLFQYLAKPVKKRIFFIENYI